jgi:alkylated DNA repair dioxygenase AlkB
MNKIGFNTTPDLFDDSDELLKNILGYDGVVNYYGVVFSKKSADRCYEHLMKNISWQPDLALIFGKTISTKRKVAWYGSKAFNYTYSNTTKQALIWTPVLLQLKEKAEQVTGETYNSCLLNLYHDGSESMAWHSDGEKDLKENGAIASLTFGAERKFSFKHKTTQDKVDINLQHGSLLVMKGQTQKHWLHRLPPTTQLLTPRINLTFRTIDNH